MIEVAGSIAANGLLSCMFCPFCTLATSDSVMMRVLMFLSFHIRVFHVCD